MIFAIAFSPVRSVQLVLSFTVITSLLQVGVWPVLVAAGVAIFPVAIAAKRASWAGFFAVSEGEFDPSIVTIVVASG